MSSMAVNAEECIPSLFVSWLRSSVGLKVKAIRRYEIKDEYLDPEHIDGLFTNAEGPLLIEFDNGLVFGFGHQPSLNSVTMWLERDTQGHLRNDGVLEDPDFAAFSIDGPAAVNFDAPQLLQQRVAGWEIWKSDKYSGLPNEQAVTLKLENGQSIVVTHGLPSGSDDLKVFPQSDFVVDSQGLTRTAINPGF